MFLAAMLLAIPATVIGIQYVPVEGTVVLLIVAWIMWSGFALVFAYVLYKILDVRPKKATSARRRIKEDSPVRVS